MPFSLSGCYFARLLIPSILIDKTLHPRAVAFSRQGETPIEPPMNIASKTLKQILV